MPLKNQNSVLALDIGATNTRIAQVSGREVIGFEKVETNSQVSPDDFLLHVSKLIKNYIKKNNLSEEVEIAISVAGPIFDSARKLVFLTEINGEFVPFVELERLLNREICLINDASAAALAEQCYGVKSNNLIYLTISSGIGAGIIRKGRLLPDQETEVGHLEIDSKYQTQCICDGVNHWEAYTSGKNLIKFYEVWKKAEGKKAKAPADVYDLFASLKKRKEDIVEFVDVVHRINAQGIAMINNKFRPDQIVLGGGLVFNEGTILLGGLKKHLPSEIYNKISVTELGDEISLIGAPLCAEES